MISNQGGKEMKNTEKDNSLLIATKLGTIVVSTTVIEDLTKDILKEIPGIDKIQLKLLGKRTDSGKVLVLTNEESNAISLTVSVCLGGYVPVKTVATQIQERLIHEIPKLAGIDVEEVIVKIEKINL